MIKSTILVVLLSVAVQASKITQINLVPGLDPYILMNPRYPDQSEPEEDITWIFDTQPPAKISIHCADFRFVKTNPCIGTYVVINSGQPDEVTLCGAHFDYQKLSQTSRMTLRYLGGPWGGGAIKCLVQATTSDNIYHYHGADPSEVDSAEAGLVNLPGRRTTSCKCGWVNKRPARIYGGREVSPNEYPWLVALMRGDERRMPFCGGSIITSYHVLSAAHCFTDRKGQLGNDNFLVSAGEHDWQVDDNKARQLIKVDKVIIYQNYTSYVKDFDIALLYLEKEIQFNEFVGPICLPNGRLDVRDKWLKVMGWGRVNQEYYSTVAKMANVKGVDINICNAKFLYLMRTEDTFHVCTWAQGTDSCKGDSGGPLVWLDPETNRYTQSALVSHAMGCGDTIPSVNTDVSYFLDWIQLEIQNTNPSAKTCSKV
uniref:Venom S1 protease with CUB domain 11 n=1 Tax=Oncocephalus sp. TaxID=2944721 RepID=A0AB38ZER5_9HEMI